jgi:hypothetical protein
MRCNFCDKIVNALGPTDFGRSTSGGGAHDRVRVRCVYSPHSIRG